MSHLNTLFHSVDLGANLTLKNRIIMAPLTRSMADDNLVPTEAMAAYYGRRADAGLIISEATLVSQDGQGYPNTPGLYTQAQIDGWKTVTQRVHQNGGKIFAQIWHTGRVSHSIYHNGVLPMAPSAVPIVGHGHVPRTENLEYETPRVITKDEIKRVQNQFAIAAKNAIEAGFDGVEIHGANSYLIDEFLHWDTNRREDEYGGTVENMTRFLIEVIDQVKAAIPEGKVGLRLSPQAYINLEHDDRDKQVFDYLLPLLNQYDLAYVHTGMFSDEPYEHLGGTVTQYIRQHYRGTLIASGGYSVESGAAAIESGDADLIAIGRPFIANPDFVEKVKQEKALVEYNNDMLHELY
ncbi:alkene reductase [Marinomonas sp. PE14-40]|uniref:alkene reductase n=1 Tax=Marinomonas sp. PE14-40 TaxID=3060621 RepID=UPI003F68123D